jgi:hypothetical protein
MIQNTYTIRGQVTNSLGEAIMGQHVLAADVDLRGAAIYKTVATVGALEANKGFQILGRTETNINGGYEIRFTPESYRRDELGLADVVVFAIEGDNIVARSNLANESNYKGNTLQNWNVQLPDASKRGVSEYTRLLQVIEPFVRESGLQLADLAASADQISFLASETKQDPQQTSLAVQSAQLVADYPKDKLPAALFYGIGRQHIDLSLSNLLVQGQTALAAAIQESIDGNIIPPQKPNDISKFLDSLTTIAVEYSITAAETAPLVAAIGFSIKDPALQKTFIQSYLTFTGQPADFWNGLSKQPGFTAAIITSLQLTNQLSILTGQNTALMEELQVTRGVKDASDLLSLTTADWTTIVTNTGVPASVPGATPADQVSNYITGMQGVLNATYPTQRIDLMIVNNQLPIADANVKEAITAFFSASPDFDISSSRISAFDKSISTVAGKYHDQVVAQLQVMQRIYQVSPTPDVMNTLLQRGYTSAYAIAYISQHSFVQAESAGLGGDDIALSVYNRARNQVARAYYTFLRILDTQDKATPAKIISPAQRAAVSNSLSQIN